jgi:hypothetical protein
MHTSKGLLRRECLRGVGGSGPAQRISREGACKTRAAASAAVAQRPARRPSAALRGASPAVAQGS